MKWRDAKVGVLLGGVSEEREVSLRSGAAMAAALERRGYDVVRIDAGRDLAQRLTQTPIDVAVLALHGCWGEDGQVQGLLETLQIPYTASAVTASALCMDKGLTKRVLRDGGIATPPWHELDLSGGDRAVEEALARLEQEAPGWFVKPQSSGSSVGISRADDLDGLRAALREAARVSARVMVEQAVSGAEVTVPVLDGEPLPAIQIRPKEGFYDYINKYTSGRTEYLIPPQDVAGEPLERVCRAARLAYRLAGCRGMARVDFMVEADGGAWALEINTIPGMTENSLVPKSAAAAGIDFDELVERILDGAALVGCGDGA